VVEEGSPVRHVPKYDFSDDADEELSFARQRASKVIEGSTILDTKTGHKALKLENEFEDQVSRRDVCTHFYFYSQVTNV
jgi:hypothetical protein